MLNSIEKRETCSETIIGDRCFVIESYDPLVGNYILMQLFTYVLPMGLDGSMQENIPGSEKVLSGLERKTMSKREFIDLQRDILSTVYEKYSTGQKSPVVRENGTYGISDISVSLCLRLIISSLAFNFKSFFEEEGLSGVLGNL